MRPFALALSAALLGALALPAVAPALIQVDKGIAGARLNNTVAQVHAALGKPTKTAVGFNDFGRYREDTFRGGIVVTYQGRKRVTAVSTTGLGDRTARGIGVRSTEAALTARERGLTCESLGDFRHCYTNDFLAGQRVTDWWIEDGRVSRVRVGFVID